MLYYLFDWLDKTFNMPGAGVFQYITFRAAMASITSLLIMIIFGKRFINYLRRKQIGETVRDLNLEGQKAKEGTPTMGGLLILAAIIIPTLLFAKLNNIYVLIMLGTTVWPAGRPSTLRASIPGGWLLYDCQPLMFLEQ